MHVKVIAAKRMSSPRKANRRCCRRDLAEAAAKARPDCANKAKTI
jgi:hypothetical protein